MKPQVKPQEQVERRLVEMGGVKTYSWFKMVTLLFSSPLVHANTWLLLPGSWTNSEALRSVRPTVVFGKIPLSSWGDDESNRTVRRRKRRPSKEAALAVAEEELVDDEVVDDDEVDDDVADDDVGPDGEKKFEFLSIKSLRNILNVLDWLELEVKFWKLPWTKW